MQGQWRFSQRLANSIVREQLYMVSLIGFHQVCWAKGSWWCLTKLWLIFRWCHRANFLDFHRFSRAVCSVKYALLSHSWLDWKANHSNNWDIHLASHKCHIPGNNHLQGWHKLWLRGLCPSGIWQLSVNLRQWCQLWWNWIASLSFPRLLAAW